MPDRVTVPVAVTAHRPDARRVAGQLRSAALSHSLPRFVLVGGLSFAVDAGTLWLLHGVAGVALPIATTLAFTLSLVVNFTLNRSWAFGSRQHVGRQLVRYGVLVVVNYLLTLGIVVGVAAAGVYYLLSKVISTGVVAVVNYVAYRWWVFR